MNNTPRYSNNTNQNMPRKISEPNLRRHFEQQPGGSLRKLSDSQLPRKLQSDYYSQQPLAARKLSDSQLPGKYLVIRGFIISKTVKRTFVYNQQILSCFQIVFP